MSEILNLSENCQPYFAAGNGCEGISSACKPQGKNMQLSKGFMNLGALLGLLLFFWAAAALCPSAIWDI